MTKQHFRCIKTLDVQWGDMDALGHVNNSMYFRYFETGRIAYFDAIGEQNFAHGDTTPVLAHIELNYRFPVVYPAQLDVCVRVSELRNRSLVMDCKMYFAGTERLVADGTSVLVWVNKSNGSAVSLSETLRAAVQSYEQIE